MELYFNFWQICYQNHSSWVEKKISVFTNYGILFGTQYTTHLHTHTYLYVHIHNFFPLIGLKIFLPLYFWKSAKSGSFSNLLVRKLKMKVQIRSPSTPKAEPILDIGFKSSYCIKYLKAWDGNSSTLEFQSGQNFSCTIITTSFL